VAHMAGIKEEERNNFSSYMLNNFVLKGRSYVHHSNEQALNALSKEITETDYCLKKRIEKPLFLLLAEHSLDDFNKEKVKSFRELHADSSVILVPNGHHFLPITNSLQVANILKENYAD